MKLFQTARSRNIFFIIAGIHVGVISAVVIADFIPDAKPPVKPPIAYRVKLSDAEEPSTAPEVGPPERIPPAPPSPPIPEPPVPEPPAPEPPAPKPVPKPKPKPKPVKPKTKPKPKPKPKPVKPKTKPKPKPKPVKPKTKPVKPKTKPKTKPVKQPEVYHDSSWDNFDPNAKPTPRGGRNTNKKVPVGTRDRGQKIGPVDSRTPAGGVNNISAEEEQYISSLQTFMLEKWVRPPGILVDESTAVTVEISIDASGRVLSKRIIGASANAAVNRSAQQMLNNLSYVPRPPHGAVSYKFKLIPE